MTEDPEISLYLIDYQAGEQNFTSTAHAHKHYELFFFEKGKAAHFIDFAEYPIQDNSLFLVSYHQMHRIKAAAFTHNVGCAISFNQAYFDLLDSDFRNLFGAFGKNPAYYMEKEVGLAISKNVEQIDFELSHRLPKSQSLALYALNTILTYVYRSSVSQGSSSEVHNKGILKKFLEFLETDFNKKETVQAYADALALSTRQLNRICQKEIGQSALQIIHQRVNLEAKRLLFHTSLPIKEVCYRLGFQDPSHFSNFFKNLNAQSPERFRRKMSEIFK